MSPVKLRNLIHPDKPYRNAPRTLPACYRHWYSYVERRGWALLLLSKKLSETQYEEVWQSIIIHEGSVQHLDLLTDQEKQIFKTAFEIDQQWIISHAGDRQVHICQGQSTNLFFPSGSSKSYVNACHLQAWKQGLKSVYYLRTTAGTQAEKISKPVVKQVTKLDECIACEG